MCACERDRDRETDRQRAQMHAWCMLNKKQSHPSKWRTHLSIQFTINSCENIAQYIHRNGSRYEHKSHLLLSGDDASSNEGTQFIIMTVISLEHTHTSLSTLTPLFFLFFLFAYWHFVHSLTLCSVLVTTSSPQPSHTHAHTHHLTHTQHLTRTHTHTHTHTGGFICTNNCTHTHTHIWMP